MSSPDLRSRGPCSPINGQAETNRTNFLKRAKNRFITPLLPSFVTLWLSETLSLFLLVERAARQRHQYLRAPTMAMSRTRNAPAWWCWWALCAFLLLPQAIQVATKKTEGHARENSQSKCKTHYFPATLRHHQSFMHQETIFPPPDVITTDSKSVKTKDLKNKWYPIFSQFHWPEQKTRKERTKWASQRPINSIYSACTY